MDMSNLPVVTPENYYDPEIQMAYMGATQYKAFQKCEAAAMAELRGAYVPKSTQALLVGGYIDAYGSTVSGVEMIHCRESMVFC